MSVMMSFSQSKQKRWKSNCGYTTVQDARAAMNLAVEETKKSYIIDGEPEVYLNQIDAAGAIEICYKFQYH